MQSPAPESEAGDPDQRLVTSCSERSAEEPPFVWRCTVCLRRETFGPGELQRFLRDGWPVCCGRKPLTFLAACEPGRKC
jgi:hypothetical protein